MQFIQKCIAKDNNVTIHDLQNACIVFATWQRNMEKPTMKPETKHRLIDLKDAINQERDIALADTRVIYLNEMLLKKQNLKTELKAIRTTYKEKYEVEKQRAVNNEKQDEQTA